ncbi:helix-turn-helix domain-containing protein [Sansalvadorimonas verongulae]|uniref:helix-turn-helix domain-containing protein n=1 Tax=Sansalvadorimonas verongulae TaxID=2172824 RepID=UPI0018AD2C82|nr:helix-turn-helix transcriptional regulator [Sansalvadorimonas verongulae]
MTTLGERAKYARKNCYKWIPGRTKGYTQNDVADQLGQTRNSITQLERGEVASIKPRNLKIISAFLHIDADWLITGNMDKHPERIMYQAFMEKHETPTSQSSGHVSTPTEHFEDMQQQAARLEQISVIHALAGQILNNAKNKLPWTQMEKRLIQACKEVINP